MKRQITVLLCAAAACSMVTGTLLAFFGAKASTKVSQRTLAFEERISYQRAIEEVYWRHCIWPKERPDPKPSLGAVMSQAQVEKKVADYLRKSQTLQDYWQRPISAEQLQAEMDRMAQHTRQPQLLREVFEALGNDPFVIAECLARPVLTERLTADLSGQNRIKPVESTRMKALPSMSVATMSRNGAYTLPKIPEATPPCTDDTWTATSTTNAPFARTGHTAVWTGGEMIVWGGSDTYTLDTGGRYNPATDSWTDTSTSNAPEARAGHTAVWTGSEMIVWGGGSILGGGYLNTGGRYNPVTDSWTATNTANAPSARYGHTAVWTGSEMIIWGGYNGSELNTGGRYNPSTDTWTATSTTNAPITRDGHTAIWTGSEMIVWGGYFFDGTSHWLNTGGRFNAATESWTPTTITNAPTGRWHQSAVWTGKEMVVWGGYDGNSDVNTGGRYDPSTDNWTTTSTTSAPAARDFHTAVWTSSEMIVWGGCANCIYGSAGRYGAESAAPTPTPSEPTPSPTPTPTPTATGHGTGGRYDPGTDSWRATSTPPNAPAPRDGHTAVWTGSEMIVWGGNGDGGSLNTGGRYCANLGGPTPTATPTATVTPTPTPTPTPPTPTVTPTPTPSGITLSAHGRRVQGRHTVDLTWSPVTSANIDIYRDGVVIATVPNTGSYKDFIGVRGGNVRYRYKVCEAGTANCSNEVTVRFGGPPL
jgi:N-acetylneuraminic acid mutarotase